MEFYDCGMLIDAEDCWNWLKLVGIDSPQYMLSVNRPVGMSMLKNGSKSNLLFVDVLTVHTICCPIWAITADPCNAVIHSYIHDTHCCHIHLHECFQLSTWNIKRLQNVLLERYKNCCQHAPTQNQANMGMVLQLNEERSMDFSNCWMLTYILKAPEVD